MWEVMANTLKLFISPENQRLLATPGAFNSAPAPVFFSGNKVDLELHLYEGVGVARSPYEVPFPAGASVKVAVGTVATRPLAGQWRLSVSSTETTDLDFDATAGEVEAALNALSAVSTDGGVAVTSIGDGYVITWNTVGTKPAILSGTDTLTPSSYESILILQAGSASEREIVYVELRQTPVALAETFAPIGTPVVSATVVSAWNGTNKVYRVGIDPAPAGGSYTMTIAGDAAVIPANASIADIRSAFLAAGITIAGSVTQTGQNQHDIVLTADEVITVNGSGLIAQLGLVGELDLATSEMLAYIGSEASKDATLEITISAGGDERTVCQVPCSVANGVISSGAVGPVPIGTLLTESVANDRFVRRDTAQSPSGADLDVIWPNLGVTADGSDVAAALSGANSPASGNVFATMADVGPTFDQSLNTTDSVVFTEVGVEGGLTYLTAGELHIDGGITVTNEIIFPDATVQTTAAASYDQSLNTTDFVQFQGLDIGPGPAFCSIADDEIRLTTGLVLASDITFPDTTVQTTAFIPADYLTVSAAASTYAPLTDFDQGVKTTDSPTFVDVFATQVVLDQGLGVSIGSLAYNPNDGLGASCIYSASGVTFPDATEQTSAPVYSAGTGQSGGSGSTIHNDNYPDEVTIVIGGVTYAMPARIV